jgi:hypothetical protein
VEAQVIKLDKDYIASEFDRFFEFTTEDRSTVSSVSAKLFALHIAQPLIEEINRLQSAPAECGTVPRYSAHELFDGSDPELLPDSTDEEKS